MTSEPVTPSTATYTSLKERPVLRRVLQAAWVAIVVYIFYILVNGGTAYVKGMYNDTNIFMQIAQMGFSLFSLSTVNVVSDIYILLGYFGLTVVLFIHRSDDWLAIFLSLMVMTFGIRVTDVGNEMLLDPALRYWIAPVMMMGDAGVVLFGWLYPDGRFLPRWTKYLAPVVLVNAVLFYWPSSPFFFMGLNSGVYLGVLSLWYFSSTFAMIHRYRSVTNPNQKQQIRWVFTGLMGPLLWFVLFNVAAAFIPALQDEASTLYSAFQITSRVFSIVLFLVFPLCLTIAIARYKLFDVDLIINRALVYGALTAALVSVFGLLLILDNVLLNLALGGQHTGIVMTISAVAAGALFQPARKRLQRFVDRAFYHINIDYLKTPPDAKISALSTDTFTRAPTLFSGYKNLALIGKGGMAEVYRAEQTTQKRTVAIKVLLSNLAADEQFRKRFQREAQTLAELEHPNIVRLYDYGVENDLYFMVMEYLNGMNLSALLKEKGKFQASELLPILQDVARALDYAHSAGLVHRDIKPSNVMLDTSRAAPRAVLTDFGIAKFSRALTNITASAVLGTFDYIAPEQIEASAKVDGRADIYSLGVMTYQLLTGTLPFHRPSTGAILLAHMTAPPPDAREHAPSLPRHTALALQKAMVKNPANRFASAGEFVAALA